MKRGTTDSLKFKKLKTRLQLAEWEAIGLLESIWMFTAANAPKGDIGRHSNQDISDFIEWNKTPANDLIQALVECRWLDESKTSRLTVHDWADHRSKTKTNGSTEKVLDLPETPFVNASFSIGDELASALGEPLTAGERLTFQSIDPDFQRFWETYPRRVGRVLAEESWNGAVAYLLIHKGWADRQAKAYLQEAAKAYADSAAGMPPVTRLDGRPNPSKWLDEGRYLDDRTTWAVPNGGHPERSFAPKKPKVLPLEQKKGKAS